MTLKIKRIFILLCISWLLCVLLVGCGEMTEDKMLEKAEDLMDDQQYEEALELYEDILDDDEECVEAYLGMADCYGSLGKTGQVISILEKGYEKTNDAALGQKIQDQRRLDVKNAEKIGEAILKDFDNGAYDDALGKVASIEEYEKPAEIEEWPEVSGTVYGKFTAKIIDGNCVNIWIGDYCVYPKGTDAENYVEGKASVNDGKEYIKSLTELDSFQCLNCEKVTEGIVYEITVGKERDRGYLCEECLEEILPRAQLLGGTISDVNKVECDVCEKKMATRYFEINDSFYAMCEECFEAKATTAFCEGVDIHLFNTVNWGEHRINIQPTPVVVQDDSKVIRLYSYTDEVPDIARIYFEMHPDYELEITILSSVGGNYQQTLDYKLRNGDVDAPDIYVAEQNFVVNYIKEDMAEYAASYEELGIDVNNLIVDAQIAPYAYQVGTRPSDGKIIGLPYQSTAGCFIYNRSVAKDTWGTDAPEFIRKKIGGGSGDWEQFLIAAEELQDKGYAIVPCTEDVWKPMEKSASKGWIVDGKLYIDPKRMEYMDVAKKLYDNGFVHDYYQWSEDWFDSFAERGETKVLGFFGPAWLLQYSMADNCKDTFGDWAVTTSPVGFFWGGDWVLVNKNVSEEKKQVVADFIQWMTLESDENSLQYYWANGSSNHGVKLATPSNKVLSMVNGENEMVAGQNMYEYFIEANNMARGDNLSRYDEMIDGVWRDQVSCYMHGEKTREECLNDFKMWVEDNLNIKSN